jgi:hypothetical protein
MLFDEYALPSCDVVDAVALATGTASIMKANERRERINPVPVHVILVPGATWAT